MRRLRTLRATTLALGLCASPAAAAELARPFGGVQVAASDSGETVVVWNSKTGTHAAFGTPGAAFSAPATIAPANTTAFGPALAMDGAGNAVVVWEVINGRDCYKGSCIEDSVGVFALIRPAGGAFGPIVRLAPAQSGARANPQLVMNRAGDWVVLMTVGGVKVVGAGRGATPPAGFGALAAPGFQASAPVAASGIDEAGNATFAGRDAAEHPATIVRKADGTFADYTVLDDAAIPTDGLKVGVGPQGHAVAVWPGGGFLRWATRQPGEAFGPPTTSAVASGLPPGELGVDAVGRTYMVRQPLPVFPARFELEVRRGTVSAPFGAPATLTAPDRDNGGARFALGPQGNAAVSWFDTQRALNLTARVAIATDAGPFSAPLTIRTDISELAQLPDVAIDGAGRAVLAWTETAGTVQRVLATALTPAAVAGPTVVAQAALTAAPSPQGRASSPKLQVLRIRSDGTVRPKLVCVSPQASCYGTLRIDVRPRPGAKRIRLGSHSFVFARGRSAPVVVRVTRAARRAAARRTLKGTITVTTNRHGAQGVAFTDAVGVTVRRTRR